MGRKSAIAKLPKPIQEAVDALIRDNSATIDEIVEAIQALGGKASHSSVGRHVQKTRQKMERFLEAQDMAKIWVGKLQADPDSDVGRLVSQVLRTVAWQQSASLDPDGEGTTKELAMLAGALRDLASADKLAADRELKIRKETATKAAEAAAEAMKGKGLTRETAEAIRQRILGVAA